MAGYRLFLAVMLCNVLGIHSCFASIEAQIGARAFVTVIADEDFESFSQVQYFSPLTTADYVFTGASATNGFYVGPSILMPNATDGLYQNGGFSGRLSIRHADGSDINQIQFDIGHGASTGFYAWIESFNNGASTGYSFDLDVAEGSTISLWSTGTVFDEVRIGYYTSASVRNSHVETAFTATSIDNLVTGIGSSGAVPEPQTILVWALLAVSGLAGIYQHGNGGAARHKNAGN